MREELRELAIDSFKRGQDEVTAQLQTILSRVLERVVPTSDIKFQKRGNAWYSDVDDVKFRMIHSKTEGWITQVWSPEAEWIHFGSLADLGGILYREDAEAG